MYAFINASDLLVVLGDQRVLFKVCTGRSALGSGTISVMQQTTQVRYALESAEVLGGMRILLGM